MWLFLHRNPPQRARMGLQVGDRSAVQERTVVPANDVADRVVVGVAIFFLRGVQT